MKHQRGVLQLRSSVGFFGAENVVLEIAKGLRQTDYRPFIGVFSSGTKGQEQLAEQARQHDIQSIVFQCKPRWDKKAVAEIRSFIQNNGIDIVQSHGYKADFFALAASRRLGVKKIATCHPWTETSYSRLAQLYTWIDKTLLSRFDRIVAVSEPLKNEILEKKISSARISVIENGIDLKRFEVSTPREQLRRELDLPTDRTIIGTIGRLVPEKGQQLLIEAAAILKQKFPNAFYVMVGDGDLRNSLEEQVARAGLEDRFRFLGTCNRIPEILSAMDVFTLPSISEGLPMVILEAMAAKKPIIATKVGAIPDVLQHGKAGIIILPEAGALSGALARLLSNPTEAQELATTAYQHVLEEYSSEKMVSEYIKVYDSLLN